MDGGMIHIRDKGWKKAKFGYIFDVEQEIIIDEQTHDEIEVGCARNNTYVTHLGDPETFGQKVWAEAKHRGGTSAADRQAAGFFFSLRS